MTIFDRFKEIKAPSEFLTFLSSVETSTGKLSGRDVSDAQKDGSLSINDVILRLKAIYDSLPKTIETQEEARKILDKIHDIKDLGLRNLSLKELLCAFPKIDVQGDKEPPKPSDDQLQTGAQIVSRLTKRCSSEAETQHYLAELKEGFSAVKDQPNRFQYLAEVYVSSPFTSLSICNFLEELEWPSVELKQKLLPELMAKAVFKYIEIRDVNFEHEFRCHNLRATRSIFGSGNFIMHPTPIPPTLMEGFGHAIQKFAKDLDFRLQADKESKGEQRELVAGFILDIGQSVECRFPASMISPLLPYLKDLPGLVGLELRDVGEGVRGQGFGDNDVQHLLDIARNPYLKEFHVNSDGMSELVRKKFEQDLRAILNDPKRLEEGKKLIAARLSAKYLQQ